MKDTSTVTEYCYHCGNEILREETTMWLNGKTYHIGCYYCVNDELEDVPMLFSKNDIKKIVKEEVINVFRSLSS